jgi:hypothetical protein
MDKHSQCKFSTLRLNDIIDSFDDDAPNYRTESGIHYLICIPNDQVVLDNVTERCIKHYDPKYNVIIFDDLFNDILSFIPDTIDVVIFGRGTGRGCSKFDQELCLSDNIQILILGHCFNQNIRILPRSLHTLYLGYLFNKDIRDVSWPDTLQIIKFGCSFDQDISHVKWPIELRVLIFGSLFDRDISNIILPNTLHLLKLGAYFAFPINNVNLKQVKTLILGRDFDTEITINSMYLNKLAFGWRYNRIDQYPDSLRILLFGFMFNQIINKLPPLLNVLTFGAKFNQDLTHVDIPMSLNTITFGQNYNRNLTNVIFHEIYIINDYSSKITINSSKFPNSLHKIVYFEYNDKDIIQPYKPIIQYERKLGKYTKAANAS